MAKALAEVQVALNDLKKSDGDDHLDAFNAASTELAAALKDLSLTNAKQIGMALGSLLLAAPAMLGAGSREDLDSNSLLEMTSEGVEALRSRLAANISTARNHLTDASPDLSLKLDAILKSLTEGPQDEPDTHVVDELETIFTIFHDPVIRLLGNGWQGLWGATRVGWSFFLVAFIVSILGLGQWALNLGTMHVTYQLLDVADVAGDITACYMALFGDSPHPKDPIGHVESLAGGLLKRGIQLRAVVTCLKYAVEFHGHPLTLVKKFIRLGFISIFKLLAFCFAVYALCGLAYGTALVAWRFSQLPVESRTRSAVMAPMRLYRLLRGGVTWLSGLLTQSFRRHWRSPTSSQPPLYSYNHLDPDRREIRLLKIQKPGPFRTPTYDLVIFPLDSAPPYEAMSYRWEEPCEIPCDYCYLRLRNRRLVVGHKVRKFAHTLASFWNTRWLWIDAVCINQSDDVEKLSQIGMMGDIYRSAKRTLAWLDSDPSISLLDLTLMHLLGRHLVDRPDTVLGMSLTRSRFAGAILMRMWKVRTRLLRQSYWSRGWIVQEVALAKAVVVIYGGQLLELLSLINSVATSYSETYSAYAERHLEQMSIAALEVEKGKGAENGPLSRSVLSRETKSQISALGLIYVTLKSHGLLDLATLLSMTMERGCSEKKDKVLCLLGMVRDHEQFLGKSGETVQTTFQNAAKAILPSYPDFILQCGGIGYTKSVTPLPTWVPDWSVVSMHEQDPLLIKPKSFYESLGVDTDPMREVYRSGMPLATDPPLKPPITILGAQLTIQAVKLSRIKKLSAPCLKTFPNVLLRHEDIAAIMAFQKELDDSYAHSGQTAEEAFARTLVGDRWWLSMSDSPSRLFPAPSSVTDAYKKCKEMVAEQVEIHAGASDDDIWDQVLLQDGQLETRMEPDDHLLAVKYFQNLIVRGKCVGLTMDGHVCLVPHLTQNGDQIVVVPGIHRPIILRAGESGQWDLVGSCYVHGIMSGEILARGEQVLDVFEIR